MIRCMHRYDPSRGKIKRSPARHWREQAFRLPDDPIMCAILQEAEGHVRELTDTWKQVIKLVKENNQLK